MSSPIPGDLDEAPRSRFTFRDLKLLSQNSVNSPLRVITLIDFDCFYAQCESVRLGLSPDNPLGVQQFKHVIAINYPARAAGLKKVVSAEEAKLKCPNIVLQHVPTWREGDTTWRYRDDALEHMDIDKSSLDYYRLQSKKAMAVLKATLLGDHQIIERAGIDETYVDLSEPVYNKMLEQFHELRQNPANLDCRLPLPMDPLLDWADTAVEADTGEVNRSNADWDDVSLHIGCDIVKSIRNAIQSNLHYTCSAGIAHNKVVAKLAAGHNKPNRQTVVLSSGISAFLSSYKFTKIRGLGGKLGKQVAKAFDTELVSELLQIPRAALASKVGGSSASWVYNVIRGHETSEVTDRTQLKSVLSAKTFMSSLQSISQAEKWLYIFSADIMGRLDDLGGDRRPKTVACHLQVNGPRAPMRSKQCPIPSGLKLDVEALLKLSRELLLGLEKEGPTWPLVTLSVSATDLQDVEKGSRSVEALFAAAKSGITDSHKHTAVDLKDGVAIISPEKKPIGAKKRTLFDLGFSSPATTEDRSRNAVKRHRSSEMERVDEMAETKGHTEGLTDHIDRQDSQHEETGVYECPNCDQLVPASAVLGHLDWHFALELSENG